MSETLKSGWTGKPSGMPGKGALVGDLEWDGLHRPRIYYAVITTFCGLFLSVLDGTICNVALPTIALRLDISPSDSIWIVNAFQLVIMMLLLPFSSLGELYGYKKVYLSFPEYTYLHHVQAFALLRQHGQQNKPYI